MFRVGCSHVFRKDRRHENSKVQKWRHVPSKGNLADHAPRGLVDVKSRGKCSLWMTAPQFLWEPERTWPLKKDVQIVSDTDVEVKYSLKLNLVSSRVNIDVYAKCKIDNARHVKIQR